MSSTIISWIFSGPRRCFSRYSASAAAAISGMCSCSASASTSASVNPLNAMQSSSVIMTHPGNLPADYQPWPTMTLT